MRYLVFTAEEELVEMLSLKHISPFDSRGGDRPEDETAKTKGPRSLIIAQVTNNCPDVLVPAQIIQPGHIQQSAPPFCLRAVLFVASDFRLNHIFKGFTSHAICLAYI